MKKLLALLLALVMVLSLAACGEKEEESLLGNLPDAPSEAPTEPPTEPPPTEPPKPAGTAFESALWSLYYLEDDGWVLDPEDVYESETRSDAIFTIPDPEDPEDYTIMVSINVYLGDPYSFRDMLVSYGFDQYEYEVNQSYELVSIGGVDCLTEEGNYWGLPCRRYLNRFEGAGATVLIEIVGEYDDPRVTTLLDTLQITLEDTGNVDGPWYWEGEPFSSAGGSAMAGTVTVTSQWIPFTDCLMTNETFNHVVTAAGGKVYLLTDGILQQYAFDGSALTYEADIAVEGEFESLCAVQDGSIWVGGFLEPMINLKDGTPVASYEGPDYIAMHPSGSWGISYFSGPDCEKFDLSGGAYATTPISFPEVGTLSYLTVDKDYIYACGYAADDSGHKIFVYDTSGNLKMTLDNTDDIGLGSITYVTRTPGGFMALDGNMRSLVLWTADGSFIGEIDDTDLFGTSYPWFCGATMLDDGSVLAIMTEDRADLSAMELVAFKLSGF